MKRLKKGFTLIELLVVIAIIGILATTLAPKLREQLAKAKDAKAVALLGAARTAASTLAIDKMVQATGATVDFITATELAARLDAKSNEVYTSSSSIVLVGGTRDTEIASVKYDGEGVTLVTSTSGTSLVAVHSAGIPVDDDEIILNLLGEATKDFSTEGKEWSTY